jgi:hypothetical protein
LATSLGFICSGREKKCNDACSIVEGNKMNEDFIREHVVIERRLQFSLLWKYRAFISLSDWNLHMLILIAQDWIKYLIKLKKLITIWRSKHSYTWESEHYIWLIMQVFVLIQLHLMCRNKGFNSSGVCVGIWRNMNP